MSRPQAPARGRVKRRQTERLLQERLPDGEHRAAGDPTCPLCGRLIPPAQRDAHHLVPKSRGGTRTEWLHRICHRQIHALFSEAELERQYPDVAALLAHPDVARFAAWVAGKPDDFFERTRKSARLRSR